MGVVGSLRLVPDSDARFDMDTNSLPGHDLKLLDDGKLATEDILQYNKRYEEIPEELLELIGQRK